VPSEIRSKQVDRRERDLEYDHKICIQKKIEKGTINNNNTSIERRGAKETSSEKGLLYKVVVKRTLRNHSDQCTVRGEWMNGWMDGWMDRRHFVKYLAKYFHKPNMKDNLIFNYPSIYLWLYYV